MIIKISLGCFGVSNDLILLFFCAKKHVRENYFPYSETKIPKTNLFEPVQPKLGLKPIPKPVTVTKGMKIMATLAKVTFWS